MKNRADLFETPGETSCGGFAGIGDQFQVGRGGANPGLIRLRFGAAGKCGENKHGKTHDVYSVAMRR